MPQTSDETTLANPSLFASDQLMETHPISFWDISEVCLKFTRQLNGNTTVVSHFPPFSAPSSSSLFFLQTTSKHLLFTVFFACASMQDTHANTVMHTHLCLYLITGSITGDILPDNASEGDEPGRPNERGEISLSLITWKPQYWHSHWLRWMNLIYLPFEAQMTSWYGSLSLYRRRPLFFCSACEIWKCTGRHLKGFWQRLICFVAWCDSCISLSI